MLLFSPLLFNKKQSEKGLTNKGLQVYLGFVVLMWKCAAHWWGPRTSNPMWGVRTVPGGFDSHALPPFYPIISIV